MHLSYVLLIPASMLLCGVLGSAQGADDPPGSIKLLTGYTHQRLRGIDTQVGKISRKDGLTIQYDIGELAGNYAAQRKSDAAWFKEQVIDGRTVQVALSKDRQLTVTFTKGPANFVATLKSDEDLAEVLLMLCTYSPK